MGANFNCVVVPKKIQEEQDLQDFYNEYRDKLIENYGDEFEGYTGDMAVDDGYLKTIANLEMKFSKKTELKQRDIEKIWSELLELCSEHCEKWGPSIAVRVNDQWVICGSYSD